MRGDERGLDEPMAAVDGQNGENGHDGSDAGLTSDLESRRAEEA